MEAYLTRRAFLKGTLALALFGPGCINNARPDLVQKADCSADPSKLAKILREQGIEATPTYSAGNRTLLIVAEHHSRTSPEQYSAFFNQVNNRARLSAIFLEGLGNPKIFNSLDEQDKENRNILEMEDSTPFCDNLQIRQKYPLLKRDFSVYGIEDNEVSTDAQLMQDIVIQTTLLYLPGNSFKKSEEREEKLNRFLKKLRTVKLEEIHMPEKYGTPQYREFLDKVRKLNDELALKRRNDLFARTIDAYLKLGETGALIVGEAHVIERGVSAGQGSVLENLAKYQINTVVITDDQISGKK